MRSIKVYFSDFFDIDDSIIEEYGAVNISLIKFIYLIDPFYYFNSEDPDFQKIHKENDKLFIIFTTAVRNGL